MNQELQQAILFKAVLAKLESIERILLTKATGVKP